MARRPELSVIIAVAGSCAVRRFNTTQCLSHLAEQSFQDYELVVVEQSLDGECYYADLEPDRYLSISDPDKRSFNLSWCRNVGAHLATSNRLLFIDADLIFAPDYLDKVVAQPGPFSGGCRRFIWSSPQDVDAFRAGRGMASFSESPSFAAFSTYKDNNVGKGGAHFFSRPWFLDVFGGYCENFFKYGWEDDEAIYRISKLVRCGIPELPVVDADCIHLAHEQREYSNSSTNQEIFNAAKSLPFDALSSRMRTAATGDPSRPTLICLKLV